MTEVEKNIQSLISAISGIEKVQEMTTKNVDRLVLNVEKILPVYAQLEAVNKRVENLENDSNGGIRPNTLKHILVYVCLTIISFNTWITVYLFENDKELSNHAVEYKEFSKHINQEIENLKEKNIKNTNQIVYLKGSKANKPKE